MSGLATALALYVVPAVPEDTLRFAEREFAVADLALQESSDLIFHTCHVPGEQVQVLGCAGIAAQREGEAVVELID